MHHHHEDDAEALGVVDPVDPARGRLAALKLRLTDRDVAHMISSGSARVAGCGLSHFNSYSSHIRMDELNSPLPIQGKCHGRN
jgi:hypothetical protein